MRLFVNLLLALIAASTALTQAACTKSDWWPDDVDRVVVIRCAFTASDYPCFRATLSMQGGRISVGRLRALKGVLRGEYRLASGVVDQYYLTGELARPISLLTVSPPDAIKELDGTIDVVAFRHCGELVTRRTFGGIEDAAHWQWLLQLDHLQATIMSLSWDRIGDVKDVREMDSWLSPKIDPSLLEP